jgi:formylglycine-generating enzyme required for sulfatase activity
MFLVGLVGAPCWIAGCASLLGFEDDRLSGDSSAPKAGETHHVPASAGAAGAGGATSTVEHAGNGGVTAADAGAGGTQRGISGEGGNGGQTTEAGAGGYGGVAGAGGALGGDGAAAGESTTGGSPPADCGGHAGPKMVRVGTFCIDETEVTLKQFREFTLDHVDPATVKSCEWKEAFADLPVERANFDLPVDFVDWCDAKAYCEWAGKRLCGKIGGGALKTDPIYTADASQDEWFRTCSDDGSLEYVYGNSYQPNVCNTEQAHEMSRVGTYPGCMTKAGVLDLLGNVFEWENACDEDASGNPAQAKCAHRGGSAYTGDTRCSEYATEARSFTAPDLGFRCCSD